MNPLTKRAKEATRLNRARMSLREKATYKSIVIWFVIIVLIAGFANYSESVRGGTSGEYNTVINRGN